MGFAKWNCGKSESTPAGYFVDWLTGSEVGSGMKGRVHVAGTGGIPIRASLFQGIGRLAAAAGGPGITDRARTPHRRGAEGSATIWGRRFLGVAGARSFCVWALDPLTHRPGQACLGQGLVANPTGYHPAGILRPL